MVELFVSNTYKDFCGIGFIDDLPQSFSLLCKMSSYVIKSHTLHALKVYSEFSWAEVEFGVTSDMYSEQLPLALLCPQGSMVSSRVGRKN